MCDCLLSCVAVIVCVLMLCVVVVVVVVFIIVCLHRLLKNVLFPARKEASPTPEGPPSENRGENYSSFGQDCSKFMARTSMRRVLHPGAPLLKTEEKATPRLAATAANAGRSPGANRAPRRASAIRWSQRLSYHRLTAHACSCRSRSPNEQNNIGQFSRFQLAQFILRVSNPISKYLD